MSSGPQDTAVTVEFSTDSTGSQTEIEIEIADDVPTTSASGYYNVYSYTAYSLFSNSGSTALTQSGLTKDVTEYITMSFSTSAKPNKPVLAMQSWSTVGQTYGGGTISFVNGEFVSDKPVVAIIEASYTTRYDRGVVNFPAESEVEPVPGEKPAVRPPVVVAAISAQSVATVTFNPPSRFGGGGFKYEDSGGRQSRLVIEVLEPRLQRIQGGVIGGNSWITAIADVNIYTAGDSVNASCTTGKLWPSGTTRKTYDVVEYISFDANGIAQLKYPAWSTPMASAHGEFIDSDGDWFIPSFSMPETTVYIQEGMSPGTNKVLGMREIACTQIGRVIKCVGTARVVYTVSVESFQLEFDRNYDQPGIHFLPSTVVADSGIFSQAVTQKVDPPAGGGRK